MAKNTKLWSDKKITQVFAPCDRGVAKEMRNEYEAERDKLRTEIHRLTAAGYDVACGETLANEAAADLETENDKLRQQVADLYAELSANNATVALLVSRIEDEKVTALRAEIAAANAKAAELTEEVATLTRINSELNYTADILAAMVKEE